MTASFKQAERLQKLPPYLFVRLEQLAAKKKTEGVRMIDFGIGDPDLPCPGAIVKSMQHAALVNENQKYSSSK
ncbi:MAG: aspartate aminotransferase, partial [Candidatus Methanomethylophilus sp.]|nr:aspartate aminotransferase [Methanomethylophilus sp.]